MFPFASPMLAQAATGSLFPFSIPFTNPGGETGDLTGWTQITGTGFVLGTTGGDGPHSGTYRFILSNDSLASEVKADPLDMPAGALTQVDAGTTRATISFWINGRLGLDGDWGRARLEFWSGSGGTGIFLGCRTSDQLIVSSWTQKTFDWNVPPGTRSVVFYFFGRRGLAGTNVELSFYFDDLQPISLQDGYHCDRVYAARGSESGWTVTTGSGQPTSVVGSDWNWTALRGGSQAAYSIYKDVAVSSLSAAAQAAIAAGSATLHLHRYTWNTNGADKSRSRAVCRASGADVATVQDAAATTNWGTVGNFLIDGTVAAPTSTDTIRIMHDYTRVDGTVLDASIAFVDVWLTW